MLEVLPSPFLRLCFFFAALFFLFLLGLSNFLTVGKEMKSVASFIVSILHINGVKLKAHLARRSSLVALLVPK
jgi:hypothetical protein